MKLTDTITVTAPRDPDRTYYCGVCGEELWGSAADGRGYSWWIHLRDAVNTALESVFDHAVTWGHPKWEAR